MAWAAVMAGIWIYAGVVSHTDSMQSVVGQALVFPAVLWRFGATARRASELARKLRRNRPNEPTAKWPRNAAGSRASFTMWWPTTCR
ncbi:hypothetical protein AB0D12_33110 [Streptomyces sp. NPDC048479]|uniref:hypothetical protein n=1 Tax=Streptomyces sp. NPDC048479 TaxID=3154725 RepID=UPI003422A261